MKKILSIFLIAGIGGFTALSIYKAIENNNSESKIVNKNQQIPAQPVFRFANLKSIPENTIDFTIAAEMTVNSVVHVKTLFHRENYNNYYDPFYEFLWGRGNKTPQPAMGSGSGVIISDDGYIATNYHVIKQADNIEITLNNKKTYKAEVIGIDPSTDIALLKIAETNLPYISYGNSDNVKVGEWVLAVGNPYNLTSTVTAGIVSAKGRNINILRDKFKIESFIQTDAAVNPGNSGGALVNTRGELIGLNSAIASMTGSFTGYSFAIPVNIVKKVINDLMEYGTVQRAFIGISINNIDAELAGKLNIDEIRGVYISGLSEDGAAKDAGIRKGDIIIKINNEEVNKVPELQEHVSRYRPGDKIQVSLIRNGKEIILPVILKNIQGNTKIIKKEKNKTVVILGASFEIVSDEEKRILNIKNGLKVTKLNGGKFRSAGIKTGFIITEIDRKKIYNLEDITVALENKRGGVLIEGIYPNGIRAYYGFGV